MCAQIHGKCSNNEGFQLQTETTVDLSLEKESSRKYVNDLRLPK